MLCSLETREVKGNKENTGRGSPSGRTRVPRGSEVIYDSSQSAAVMKQGSGRRCGGASASRASAN